MREGEKMKIREEDKKAKKMKVVKWGKKIFQREKNGK